MDKLKHDYGKYVVRERHKGQITGEFEVGADDAISAMLKAREELYEAPTYEVISKDGVPIC